MSVGGGELSRSRSGIVGLHTARFLTCVHDRFLRTGLAYLADHTHPPPLGAASRTYNDALENLSRTTGLTA
jgi:hypothetical protein